MKVNRKILETDNKEISFTHIETGSNKICFMFSGGGYTYDKPLFYYSTMTMLQNKIDVIHIHYSYDQHIFKNTIEEITEIMMSDINPVLLDVLKNNRYSETIFLGKSLGTIPIATDLMKRNEFLQSKMILLTPLLKFHAIFETILNSDHHGLLVIGDNDPHYNFDQIEQLNNSNIKIEVFKNANHSLDVGEYDISNSLLAISSVMEQLQKVISEA